MPWPKGRPCSDATRRLLARPKRDVAERFWEKVDRSGGPTACWPWLASTRADGYGQFGWGSHFDGTARPRPAHQVAWVLTHGEPPAGRDLDHLCHTDAPECPGGACRHRACVNPAHLRTVPRSLNVLAGRSLPAKYAVRSRCQRGHLLDEANTLHRRMADGTLSRARECRRCRADTEARRREKKTLTAI